MIAKSKVLRVLWVIIAIIAVASLVCLLVFWLRDQQWKGIFLAVCGGFLVLNLLISTVLIKRNFRG